MSQIYQNFYRQADAFFTVITAALFVISLLLASWYNTWSEALLIGLPALLIPIAISKAAPCSRWSRIAFGVSLMIFAALQIHQAHGMHVADC